MLRPPELEANLPTLNQVAEDALDHLAAKRHEAGGDDQGEVDDLEGEILKWTSECESLTVTILFEEHM